MWKYGLHGGYFEIYLTKCILIANVNLICIHAHFPSVQKDVEQQGIYENWNTLSPRINIAIYVCLHITNKTLHLGQKSFNSYHSMYGNQWTSPCLNNWLYQGNFCIANHILNLSLVYFHSPSATLIESKWRSLKIDAGCCHNMG